MTLESSKSFLKLDYEGFDFSNQKFDNLNIECCNFYSTNFSNVTIKNSDIRNSLFNYSRLSKLKLEKVKLKKCDFRGSELDNSSFSDCDLTGCNFWEASLLNIRLDNVYLMDTIGNGKEIKSLQIGTFTIVYTCNLLQVGCKIYPIDKWSTFTNRDLLEMGGREAAKFWNYHGDEILNLVRLSPATKSNRG